MIKNDKLSNVEYSICEILNKEFEIDIDIARNNSCEPLTGSYFKLNGFQLYQLLMVIEEKFQVYFHPPIIQKNGFNSIRDIAKLIQAK